MNPWRRTVLAVFAAVFPAGEQLPGLDRERAAPFFAAFFREAPAQVRWGVHLCVLVFLVTPVLTVGRPLPATWLGRERLDRHADRLAHHRSYALRQVMKLLKAIGGLAWGADADVRRALGQPEYGPDSGTWRRA